MNKMGELPEGTKENREYFNWRGQWFASRKLKIFYYRKGNLRKKEWFFGPTCRFNSSFRTFSFSALSVTLSLIGLSLSPSSSLSELLDVSLLLLDELSSLNSRCIDLFIFLFNYFFLAKKIFDIAYLLLPLPHSPILVDGFLLKSWLWRRNFFWRWLFIRLVLVLHLLFLHSLFLNLKKWVIKKIKLI